MPEKKLKIKEIKNFHQSVQLGSKLIFLNMKKWLLDGLGGGKDSERKGFKHYFHFRNKTNSKFGFHST